MVEVVFRDERWEVAPGQTVRRIIEAADLRPEALLALRDGKLIPPDTVVEAGDTIKLVAVVSGG